MNTPKYFVILLVWAVISLPVQADGNDHHHGNAELFSGLNSRAANTVKQFHMAQESGDKEMVLKLLSDDVMIFEGGGIERSARQYASHHMGSDMKFLSHMTITTKEHHVKVHGDMAVSMSKSHLKGTYKDKDYDRESMETMTLIKENGQWRINHIHWSN